MIRMISTSSRACRQRNTAANKALGTAGGCDASGGALRLFRRAQCPVSWLLSCGSVAPGLAAQVQGGVQLRQTGRLLLQLILHGEGFCCLGLGGFHLLAQVGELGPVFLQVLRQLLQGVVYAGDVAGGALAQGDGILDDTPKAFSQAVMAKPR